MLSLLLSVLATIFVASSPANAAPYEKRGLAQVISQCNHDFAYTWDDGPYVHNANIRSAFQAVGGKTTFFVNGDNYSCIYDQDNVQRLRDAYSAGHQIASHTWSHRNLVTLSEAEIDYEIQRLDEAFIKIIGVRPKFLRPPYGGIDERTSSYIQNRHGKTIVLWSDDSGDSTGGSADDSYNFYARLANAGPGGGPHMTLSHETSSAGTDAMYRGTVGLLANAGIKLITVAQCLNAEPYEYFGGFGNRDSSWYCGGNWTPSNPTPTVTTSSTPAPTCVATIRSQQNDSCASIGTTWHLSANAILAANPFLNCNDIWVNTPICIPPGGFTTTPTPTSTPTTTRTSTSTTSTSPPGCVATIRSQPNDTCASIGTTWHLSGDAILAANQFLNCNDIWVNTPICIPTGGYTTTPTPTSTPTTTRTSTSTTSTSTPPPGCVATIRSSSGDTCDRIGSNWGISGNAILAANTFLNCNDIWVNTPICIPPGGTPCQQTITVNTAGQTCASIGTNNGVTGAQIQAWNSFLNCNDIWVGTQVCVRH